MGAHRHRSDDEDQHLGRCWRDAPGWSPLPELWIRPPPLFGRPPRPDGGWGRTAVTPTACADGLGMFGWRPRCRPARVGDARSFAAAYRPPAEALAAFRLGRCAACESSLGTPIW